MCHAACQPPHCIHLLRLAELSFKLLSLYFMLLSLFFVPLQCVAHVLESPGDPCHFVTTMRFQRIDEIAMFEGAHSVCEGMRDRKSTRLNSSHTVISYAVFCLKKKKQTSYRPTTLRRRHRHTDTHY